MSATNTKAQTLTDVLDRGNLNSLDAGLHEVKIGSMLAGIDEVITVSPAATTAVLSKQALALWSVTVLTGAAAAGARIVGDASVTPSATVVKLGNDGKTLTFEANVATVRCKYVPASATSMTTAYPIL